MSTTDSSWPLAGGAGESYGFAVMRRLLSIMAAGSVELCDDVAHEDEEHQDQRGGPGDLDLVAERRGGEIVDEHGQRGDRLHRVARQPVVAEQGREQKRRGLAGGAGCDE